LGVPGLEKKGMKPTSLAVDPKTGNVWVLTSEETIYGKSLIVLSSSGKKIHDWDHRGFVIVQLFFVERAPTKFVLDAAAALYGFFSLFGPNFRSILLLT